MLNKIDTHRFHEIANNKEHCIFTSYFTRKILPMKLRHSDCIFAREISSTALARLSHRNSVRPSVCLSHGWISQNGASYMITKSSPSAAWKTFF